MQILNIFAIGSNAVYSFIFETLLDTVRIGISPIELSETLHLLPPLGSVAKNFPQKNMKLIFSQHFVIIFPFNILVNLLNLYISGEKWLNCEKIALIKFKSIFYNFII